MKTKMKLTISFVIIVLFFAGCTAESMNNAETEQFNQTAPVPSEINADYTSYFQGIEGTAVFYNNSENTYYIYNKDSAEKPSSPCSSFKIISCLMGLESQAINPSDSTFKWSGTHYPIEAWNKDIDYKQAFKASCIWYYRKVIDSIGEDNVQVFLNRLDYGNKDISKWEGTLNNSIFPEMKDYKELNGFWQESSLQISPKQQVDVMKRIFEDKDIFSKNNIGLIKDVMRVEQKDESIQIYGKTGSGKKDSSWSDAWFVGMFEKSSDTTYFAVRLNQPDIYGEKAKEIAESIINGEFKSGTVE